MGPGRQEDGIEPGIALAGQGHEVADLEVTRVAAMTAGARMLVAAIAMAAASGCGGQVDLSGDGTADGDPTVDVDVDASHDTVTDTSVDPGFDSMPDTLEDTLVDPECPAIMLWHLETRMIESVELVDGTARMGSTQRLMVKVRLLSGCETLAGVMVDVSPGDATDFVGLLASAWVPSGVDCPPVAPLVETVVSVPGRGQDNLRVVVSDLSASGGSLRLDYDRDTCSDPSSCWCAPGAPPGSGGIWSWCESDCDCQEWYSCVGYWGVAGPLWNCVDTCSWSDPRDCYATGQCLPPIPDGVPYVCERDGACSESEPCSPGFDCVLADLDWSCADVRAPAVGIACICDAQCPAGFSCVEDAITGGGTCQIPCTSHRGCPAIFPDPMVCTNQWVCAFAD